MPELFIHPLWDWRSAICSPYGPENPVTRHVLLTIALHMSPAGDSAFPTVERLVAETALSRRTVITHTGIAERTGWLGKRERPERNGQGWRRIEYLPLVPPGREEKAKAWREAERVAWRKLLKRGAADAPGKGGARSAEGGASDDKKVVQDVHPNVSVVNLHIKDLGQPPVDNFQVKPTRSIAADEVREAVAERRAKAKP